MPKSCCFAPLPAPPCCYASLLVTHCCAAPPCPALFHRRGISESASTVCNTDTNCAVENTSIRMTADGRLVVAFGDTGGGCRAQEGDYGRLSVMGYDGDAWQYIGTRCSAKMPFDMQLAIDSTNMAYVVMSDYDDYHAAAWRFTVPI